MEWSLHSSHLQSVVFTPSTSPSAVLHIRWSAVPYVTKHFDSHLIGWSEFQDELSNSAQTSLTAVEQIVSQNRLETTDLVTVFILLNTSSYIFNETVIAEFPHGILGMLLLYIAWPDIKIIEFYLTFLYKSITSTPQNVCIGIKMD
jgi:hypothetical protein